ncbi:hypothetical protein MRX96_032703 [Rhipicephalus microplus]
MKRCFAQQWKKKDAHFDFMAFAGIGWTAILLVPLFAVLVVLNACLLNSCCVMLEEGCNEYRKFDWYIQYSDVATKALGPGVGGPCACIPGARDGSSVGLRMLSVGGLQAVVIVLTAEAVTELCAGFHTYLVALRPNVLHSRSQPRGVISIAVKGPCTEVHTILCSIVHLPLSLSLLALVLSGIADSFFGPGQWSRVFGSLIEPVGTFQNSRLQAARRGSRHPAKKTVWRTLGGAFLRGLGVIAFNFASH